MYDYVQDQNGQSLLGYYRRLYSDMQLDYIETFNNLFINNVNVHMITFSNNMFSDFRYDTNMEANVLLYLKN